MSVSFPTLRRAFVDTSAFYALADPRDNNHESAVAIRDQLIALRTRLFTTNFVLVELHALLLARLDRATAAQVVQDVDNSNTTIIRATAKDEQHAREILQKYHDKDFALCDAISFAVMERSNISAAFSFDRHFAQYGFSLVTARDMGH